MYATLTRDYAEPPDRQGFPIPLFSKGSEYQGISEKATQAPLDPSYPERE